jgi:hypothetical protein
MLGIEGIEATELSWFIRTTVSTRNLSCNARAEDLGEPSCAGPEGQLSAISAEGPRPSSVREDGFCMQSNYSVQST